MLIRTYLLGIGVPILFVVVVIYGLWMDRSDRRRFADARRRREAQDQEKRLQDLP